MTMMMRGGRHVAPAIVLDTTESHWVNRGTDLGTQHGAARRPLEDLRRHEPGPRRFRPDPLLRFLPTDSAPLLHNGRIQIGKEDYRVVILPPVEFIPAEVVERLQAFRDAGGIVVAVGRTPSASCNGQEDDRVRAAVAAVWPNRWQASWERPRSRTTTTSRRLPDRISMCPTCGCRPAQNRCSIATGNCTAGTSISSRTPERSRCRQTSSFAARMARRCRGIRSPARSCWAGTQTDGNRGLRLRLGLGEYESTFVVAESEPVALPPFADNLQFQSTTLPLDADVASRQRRGRVSSRVYGGGKTAGRLARRLAGRARPSRGVSDHPREDQRQTGGSTGSARRIRSMSAEELRPGSNRIVVERIGRFAPPNPSLPELGANDAAATAPCARATI